MTCAPRQLCLFSAGPSSSFVPRWEKKFRIARSCAGELLAPGEFDPSDAVSYYAQDRDAGYILLCTAKARSDLRIRTHVQTEMREQGKKMGLPALYA